MTDEKKDYAKIYLELQDKERGHPSESMRQVKENAEKEKLQFNAFVEFHIKEALRKQREKHDEEISIISSEFSDILNESLQKQREKIKRKEMIIEDLIVTLEEYKADLINSLKEEK